MDPRRVVAGTSPAVAARRLSAYLGARKARIVVSMSETLDELRARYKPAIVRVLFVGESPPAGGTFFYAGNSKLFLATKTAFEQALGDSFDGDFREAFRSLGCYLDDLCLRAVNHLKLTIPDQKRERLAERRAGEVALAQRMRDLNPAAIILVMSGIEENVRRAAAAAELGDRIVAVLPFPGRLEHVKRFDGGLQDTLARLTSAGILAQGPLQLIANADSNDASTSSSAERAARSIASSRPSSAAFVVAQSRKYESFMAG